MWVLKNIYGSIRSWTIANYLHTFPHHSTKNIHMDVSLMFSFLHLFPDFEWRQNAKPKINIPWLSVQRKIFYFYYCESIKYWYIDLEAMSRRGLLGHLAQPLPGCGHSGVEHSHLIGIQPLLEDFAARERQSSNYCFHGQVALTV